METRIPDEDVLYRRVHVQFTRGRRAKANPSYVSPSGFSFNDDGCSVFWERFVDEEDVRMACLEIGKSKSDYGVVKLIAGDARNHENLDVTRDPKGNFSDTRCREAHALIVSRSLEKEEILELKAYLASISKWAVRP